MSTVVNFLKAHGNTKGRISCGNNTLIESIGPTGYEAFCHFSTTTATSPHIDIFPNILNGSIVLSGNTNIYDVPMLLDGTDQDSIEQYFLEHPTREGKLQYLIEYDDNDEHAHRYKFIVPGLIYDDTCGKVLGFLKSYLTDENHNVVFEAPYNNSLTYNFSGDGLTVSQSGRFYTLHTTSNKCTVTLVAGIYRAEFYIYQNVSSTIEHYTIKNINEYADYCIAAQLVPDQNISSIKDYFEDSEQVSDPNHQSNNWYPVHFKSMYLWSFSETVKNITPNIYKVPAAFVTNGNEKVFMINVTGISTN